MDDSTEPTADIAPDAPARRLRRIPLVLAGLAVIGAGVGVGVALLGDDGDGYPSRWDPRIAELASFVERERGLEFEHPVFVDFLDAESFRRELTEHEELTDEDRAELENYEAFLRALGLVHGDIDLEQVGEDLLGEGVVGFYRFEDERIAVRGETLDDERRATLVHELTHALQDQHFDVGDREPESSGAQSAFEAVVEADAEAVKEAWVATLPAAEQEALFAAEQETADGADFEGVPEVFVDLLGYPYVL
ncbi:MAG TPA: DUF6782 family putative metallopeptidase, partial [Acidimicrobiales bacterium]|nr:DUF6782 family putative metallopeptidase [Acidimicrobiales bacterium]